MNISLIDFKPSSVILNTYGFYVSSIDLYTKTITINKNINKNFQYLVNNLTITVNKELDSTLNFNMEINNDESI